jgi:hypothetical protein
VPIGIALALLVVSPAVPAQDKPDEPTAEQLKQANDDFARIGATYAAFTDSQTKRFSHRFILAPFKQDTDLKKVPNPSFAFALSLSGNNLTDAGMKELKNLKNITTLIPTGSITDKTLRTLREIGLLHALNRATAEDGKRPTAPKEVTSLHLASTGVTDEGLKELKSGWAEFRQYACEGATATFVERYVACLIGGAVFVTIVEVSAAGLRAVVPQAGAEPAPLLPTRR